MTDPLHPHGEPESAQPASPASPEPPTIFGGADHRSNLSVPTPPPTEPVPPPPPTVETYPTPPAYTDTPAYPPPPSYDPGYATPPAPPVPSVPPSPYPTTYPPVSSAPYPPPAAGYGPPMGGYAQPMAAPAYDPVTGEPLSDKSKLVAGLLQLLLGFFFVLGGVGRLYAGNTTIGVVQIVCSVVAWISFWCGIFLTAFIVGLLFFPITFGVWVWFIVDGIMMLAGRPRDGQGRLLRA